MAKMDVSVVIPTKNRSNYVRDTIDNVLAQTVKPFEIIVVDDSDDDDTRNVVTSAADRYSGQDVVIKHFWGKKSLARGRLIGGLRSRGDLILFMDDDLDVSPDLVKTFIGGVEGDLVAVWGNIYFDDINTSVIARILSRYYYRFLFGEAGSLGGGLFAVKRSVFADKVWFDWNLKGYSLFEDKDYACSLIRRYGKDKVTFLDQNLGYNRSRLVKDALYYRRTAQGTVYFAKKHGGYSKMVASVLFLVPILSLYHSLLSGGRGERRASIREVLASFLGVLFELRLIFSGRLV